jgi:hypothetical protein
MSGEWDDDDMEALEIEVVTIAYSEPAEFAADDDDPVVQRVKEHISASISAAERSWVYADFCRGPIDVAAQRLLEGDSLQGLDVACKQSYLQMTLFSDHPEVTLTHDPEGLEASVNDLVGAMVIHASDIRERALIADMIGLMRRCGEPVEVIVDHAVVLFDAVLGVAVSSSILLWDAHSTYMRASGRQ